MSARSYVEVLKAPGTAPLYAAAFLARIPMMAVPLVLTLLVVEGLGEGYGKAGLIAALETIGIGLGAPWRGRLLDRLGLRRTIVPSIVAIFVLYPLMVTADYVWLMPLAFVSGLFVAPIHSAIRVSLAATLPSSLHRSAFALDSVMAEGSFILGPAAAGVLVVLASPQIALLSVGGAVAAGLTILWLLDPPTRSDMTTAPPERVAGFGWLSPELLMLFVISGGAMVSLMAMDLGIIAVLRELDAVALVGVVYLGWGLSSLVGGLIYGARPASIRPSVLLFVMGLLTIPVGLAHAPWSLALASIPAGLLCAPIMTASSEWIAKLTDEVRRGEAMGWQASAFTVGGALAAPLVGSAIDHRGAVAGFVVGGGAGVVIALAVIVAQRSAARV